MFIFPGLGLGAVGALGAGAEVGLLLENILGLFNPVIRELNRGRYQFAKPYVVNSKAAQETFGLSPKPWKKVIADLVAEYTHSKKNS